MTPSQLRVLTAIHEGTRTKGFAPTYVEIGKATGLKSLATVSKHIGNLAKQGMLLPPENGYRKIRMTHKGMNAVNRNAVPVWSAYWEVIEHLMKHALARRIFELWEVDEDRAKEFAEKLTDGIVLECAELTKHFKDRPELSEGWKGYSQS